MTAPRTIAISDIHGCSRALAALLRTIAPQPDETIVTLGDAIDRGPDSKGVIELLLQLREDCHLVCLLGNHEEMMLASLTSSVERRSWLALGGKPTLASYGGLEHIPREHIEFLRGFRRFYETDKHILLHANYIAHLPLDEQPSTTLLWKFLHHGVPAPHFSGKTVIVGHSPQQEKPLDLGYLIAIETDCASGGWMTGYEIDTGQIWQANQAGQVR